MKSKKDKELLCVRSADVDEIAKFTFKEIRDGFQHDLDNINWHDDHDHIMVERVEMIEKVVLAVCDKMDTLEKKIDECYAHVPNYFDS